MGRPKKFNREGVLEKAIPVFWKNGFAGTSVHELEAATGVNKSGLYSEFEGKEDLFLAALHHYLEHRNGAEILRAEPLGWNNIQTFLRAAPSCAADTPGCFSINSMRELALLSEPVTEATRQGRRRVFDLLRPNVAAEHPKMGVDAVCELIAVFFSGVCIELNLSPDPGRTTENVANFMTMLRSI
jgi:AcrR family transcriptional regulator